MKQTSEAPETKKRVSIRQIAQHAGVSIGTVSHVLNGSVAVHEKRRRRVMDAIEKLGYQPNRLARGLRSNTTDIIGMIIPDITNPFFPAVVRGAEDVAFKSGHHLVLCNSDNDPEKETSYLESIRSFFPAGLLIIPSTGSRLLNTPLETTTQMIFLDRSPSQWKGDLVESDNEGGAYQVGRHLVELGHKRMAAVTGPLHLTNASQRLAGFRRALQENGIVLDPQFIQEARFTSDSGHTAAMRLLQMLPRPTAVFAFNDLLAAGVLIAARQLKLRCPEDLSVVGFDNLDITEHSAPPLTTVHQSGYQMGATACSLLLNRTRQRDKAVERVVLPTELRIRNSTAAPARNASKEKRRGQFR
jgi:LacI family transcriptional regulator